jgi:hypothetical protein
MHTHIKADVPEWMKPNEDLLRKVQEDKEVRRETPGHGQGHVHMHEFWLTKFVDLQSLHGFWASM